MALHLQRCDQPHHSTVRSWCGCACLYLSGEQMTCGLVVFENYGSRHTRRTVQRFLCLWSLGSLPRWCISLRMLHYRTGIPRGQARRGLYPRGSKRLIVRGKRRREVREADSSKSLQHFCCADLSPPARMHPGDTYLHKLVVCEAYLSPFTFLLILQQRARERVFSKFLSLRRQN